MMEAGYNRIVMDIIGGADLERTSRHTRNIHHKYEGGTKG
jgi:hypothetical protein